MTVRRIAYVLNIFPKLSETFIANELAELRRRGIELRILSLLPPRDELRHEIISSAALGQVTHYNPENFPAILKEYGPQLLHAHFATEATAAARRLATEQEIPFTFTAHGYDIHRKPPADFASRAAAAAAVLTVSEANAAHIVKRFGVARSALRVIPCGIDLQLFHFRNGAVPGSGPPLILCVARHVEVKNLGLLLQSCAILRDGQVPFHCVLIGDGPCRKELEALSGRLGLAERVEFRGAAEQKEVARWWQRATVGVLSSNNEGMPISLMEAAGCGVPVVATNVGGVSELVEDGVTGLLAPPGDAVGFAAALEKLLISPGLCERMGFAAHKRAETRFSVQRQVDQLLALWSEILDGASQ